MLRELEIETVLKQWKQNVALISHLFPGQEGLRAAPGAAVSQLGPAELRVARLKDFEGTSWHISSAFAHMRHMSHICDMYINLS